MQFGKNYKFSEEKRFLFKSSLKFGTIKFPTSLSWADSFKRTICAYYSILSHLSLSLSICSIFFLSFLLTLSFSLSLFLSPSSSIFFSSPLPLPQYLVISPFPYLSLFYLVFAYLFFLPLPLNVCREQSRVRI